MVVNMSKKIIILLIAILAISLLLVVLSKNFDVYTAKNFDVETAQTEGLHFKVGKKFKVKCEPDDREGYHWVNKMSGSTDSVELLGEGRERKFLGLFGEYVTTFTFKTVNPGVSSLVFLTENPDTEKPDRLILTVMVSVED